MELSLSVDDLRKSLRKSWRKRLNHAESRELVVEEGISDELYSTFADIYSRMHARKGFVPIVDIDEFRSIQQRLPEGSKLRIMIASKDCEPLGAVVWSELGETGHALFSATTVKALELECMYFLKWQEVLRLKERGLHWFDLGGIDPETAPGPTAFKAGLAGKSGKDVFFVGRFESCESLLSRVVVNGAEKVRKWLRGLRVRLHRMRRREEISHPRASDKA